MSAQRPIPSDPQLYAEVKEEAKHRFNSWPSAYASGWLVKEYKRRGGTYHGKKKKNEGLDRWFKEEWVDVCKLPKNVRCGRHQTDGRKFPYCRPLHKVTPRTPKTVKELSKKELKRRCAQKRRDPEKRVIQKK